MGISVNKNNTDTKQEEERINVPVNSIQTYAYVERLGVPEARGKKSICFYDRDNYYPQKIRTIKERSKSLSTACKTFADFVRGAGWADENLNSLVLNRDGDTAFDLLKLKAEEKSEIGFALHVNYDIQGRVIEVNPIDFEALRYNKENKLVWHSDWRKFRNDEAIIYNEFNPEKVKEEIIEAGGIENYTGQVFYWKGTKKRYALSIFDAVLDDGQYEAEAKLFKLRNVQNDFTASGVFNYPKAIDSSEELKEAKKQLRNGVGAKNAGKVIFVPRIVTGNNESQKIWEPIERNDVDSLFEKQNKDSTESIYGIFRQPVILNAVLPSGGWANQQEMQDAFDYYNSIVEQDRKDVEKVFQKIIDASIWAGIKCEIKPKELIKNGIDNRTDND